MKAVLHIPSGRFVYREEPDPPDALLLANAIIETDYPKKQLVVVEVGAQDWEAETARRDAERPVRQEDQIADLLKRVNDLEKRVL